jgi:phosphoribosylformimino-5-aminoimidazole carboxamide ribotide isomerase
MILYPTIDILGGKCMRLGQIAAPSALPSAVTDNTSSANLTAAADTPIADTPIADAPTGDAPSDVPADNPADNPADASTTPADVPQDVVFDGDPIAAAQRWHAAGAQWLHIADLDGTLAGEPKHLDLVRAIAEATGLPLQLGGGLRTEDHVAAAFDAGAERVLLGTAALRHPELLASCLNRWGKRIAVSIDSRGGKVTAAGWLDIASETALEFARRMVGHGVSTFVITHAQHNGTLIRADPATFAELRAALPSATLIAAGAITSLDDLRALAHAGLDGAVLGRALYDGALDLAQAIHTLNTPPAPDEPAPESPTASTSIAPTPTQQAVPDADAATQEDALQ